MNIALYGIYGTYNFGCEAIVRGANSLIKDLFPAANIKYFSYSYEYDKQSLADINVEVVNVTENRSVLRRGVNKGLRLFNFEQRVLYFDIHQMLKDIDIVFSIGGDIYTIPAVLREDAKYPYYNPLVDFCNRCGKPIVVYGASVGPWGEYTKAVAYYKKNMMKYKAILCRELSSIEYLNSLGFTNTFFFPDPAFQLGTGRNHNGDYIGINLSPLSLNELCGSHGEDEIRKLASMLDEIVMEFNRPLLFLPHVFSPDENDNDQLFLEKIRHEMKWKDKVSVADKAGGFLKIKEQIKDCHVVISARMHCAINALEENIPTVFLSYSQKSIGMCEYVYGNKDWVINLNEMETQLMEKIRKMIKRHDEISSFLEKRNKEISKDYLNNLQKLKKLFTPIIE